MSRKAYLGDGVYAAVDPTRSAFILTTEDGVSVTNTIVLEPEVYEAFRLYADRVIREQDADAGGSHD
jgi:hypothetical protein